jgi:hypothetical protein
MREATKGGLRKLGRAGETQPSPVQTGTAMTELSEWESFYIIVGPSAGALIGLQFVVLTLIAERPSMRIAEAGAAFITPMIVHYEMVLFLSALLLAPWHSILPISIIWASVGGIGFVYECVVVRRMFKQAAYKLGFEDWIFYVVLPFVAYLVLMLSPLLASTHEREAVFAVAAATLLILFAGIHNSWDSISYHVFVVRNRPAEAAKPRRD